MTDKDCTCLRDDLYDGVCPVYGKIEGPGTDNPGGKLTEEQSDRFINATIEERKKFTDLLLKRPGKFKVMGMVLDDGGYELLRMFAKCVVVRCEFIKFDECYHYDAYSMDFDEVEEGAPIPSYEWVISRSGPAVVNVVARRLQP